MARYPLVPQRADGASAPGPYREGNSGKEVGQGQSLAAPLDSFVQRQGISRTTSDRKPGQEDPRRGQGDLGYAGKESTSHTRPQAKRLPTSTAQARLYPQEQWCSKATLDSDHERSSHAGALSP